ncbi:MAG: secD [Chlorobi bacterium]|nr:secD [Chlorobiota bacterium]
MVPIAMGGTCEIANNLQPVMNPRNLLRLPALLIAILLLPALSESSIAASPGEDTLLRLPHHPLIAHHDRATETIELQLDGPALARMLAGDRFDALLGAVFDSALTNPEGVTLAVALSQRFQRMMPAGKHLGDYFIGRMPVDRMNAGAMPDSAVAAWLVERLDSILQGQMAQLGRRFQLAGAPNAGIHRTLDYRIEILLTSVESAMIGENKALMTSQGRVALYLARDDADAVRLLRTADAALAHAKPSQLNRGKSSPLMDALFVSYLTKDGRSGIVSPGDAGVRLPKGNYSFGFIGDSLSRFMSLFNLPVPGSLNGRYAMLPQLGHPTGRSREGGPLPELFLVDRTPAMVIGPVNAIVDTIDPATGQPEIQLELSPADTKRFANLTAGNIGRKIVIAIDGEVIVAPVVRSAIPNGRISISSVTDERERKLLVGSLMMGSLEVPMRIVSVFQTVESR